jgi:competence protein ComEA
MLLKNYLLAGFLSLISLNIQAIPVDINQASADEIANALTGVGKNKAIAVVNYREAHGRFKTVDGLAHVKGIGLATVEKNRQSILLETK